MFEIRQTEEFRDWHDGLDTPARARIDARLKATQKGSLGDHKYVGERVWEMRLHHGPGYRLYFARRNNTLIIMLAGGDKGSQSRDITRAKKMALELGDV